MSTKPHTKQMIFLSAASMWPSQISERYPEAQFRARGRIAANDAQIATPFRPFFHGDVWGLLIEIRDSVESESVVDVTTDEGLVIQALLTGGALLAGEPKDVLSAGQYWELPPAHIALLKEALAAAGIPVVDEEPRDDGALEQV